MAHVPERHRRNVEGDFYVENGCCLNCMVPHSVAPDLMGYDKIENHCFVAKQPSEKGEVYRAVKAAWSAERNCIRYGGDDPQILRRLAEAGVGNVSDRRHLVAGIQPLLRNHVTFEYREVQSVAELANQFREHILGLSNEYVLYEATAITSDGSGATFAFSWYEKTFYTVRFHRIGATSTWHIFHSPKKQVGSRGVSVGIDEWLRTIEPTDIKWYTDAAWEKHRVWQDTPI